MDILNDENWMNFIAQWQLVVYDLRTIINLPDILRNYLYLQTKK